MGKYYPLFRHQCPLDDDAVELTFDEIGQLVGPLPARDHRTALLRPAQGPSLG
jgi:hypothetical protein